MTLRNAFANLATESTLADVKTAVDMIGRLKTPVWGGGQSLSVGAVSTVSAPINATAIDVTVTTPCWVHAGLAPTAIKPSSYPLFASKLPYRLPWTPGHKLAVIRDEFDGFIYISPLEP